MTRKTYRVKLQLGEDDGTRIYRTDGVPTHCCSMEIDYFCWERDTKFNNYAGWHGYVSESDVETALAKYNPDKLTLREA